MGVLPVHILVNAGGHNGYRRIAGIYTMNQRKKEKTIYGYRSQQEIDALYALYHCTLIFSAKI
jgi:hypothetical protein